MDPKLQWKRYSSDYFVSEFGDVYMIRLKRIKAFHVKDGKKTIRHKIGNKSTALQVHKMVAELYVENPENLSHIAFLNGDLLDIHYKNLKWSATKGKFQEKNGWSPLKEFEDDYEISISGVRNSKTGNILKFSQNDDYPAVKLTFQGKRSCLKVHILMAKQFVPNPNNLPCVNHKDGNIKNWQKDNLEWCTFSENMKHSYETGIRKGSKGPSITINELDQNGKIINTFSSIKKLSEVLEIDRGIVGEKICNGELILGRIFVKNKDDDTNQKWVFVNTPFEEFNEEYEVSNIGNVRRKGSISFLSQAKNNTGYNDVSLYAKSKTTLKKMSHIQKVSRLVAFSFTGSKEFDKEVNHKNKIRDDDRLENLEILDKKEHGQKDHGKPIIGFHKERCEVIAFRSISEAEIFVCSQQNRSALSIRLYTCSADYYWFEAHSQDAKKLLDAAGLILEIDGDSNKPTIRKR